jgi:prepilin-type processing-associated H-X9-DG protein
MPHYAGVFIPSFFKYDPDTFSSTLLSNRVTTPASYFLYNDSVCNASGAGYGKQCFWMAFLGGPGNYCLHLRHGGQAQTAFLDGHVNKCDEKEITQEFKNLHGFTGIGVIDKNLIGKIIY